VIDALVGPQPKLSWKFDGDANNSGSLGGFALTTPNGITFVSGKVGMAAWLRDWPQNYHVHALSIGNPDLAPWAKVQVGAYMDGYERELRRQEELREEERAAERRAEEAAQEAGVPGLHDYGARRSQEDLPQFFHLPARCEVGTDTMARRAQRARRPLMAVPIHDRAERPGLLLLSLYS
jgi:hypothetical protein